MDRVKKGDYLAFIYINWKGEISEREIIVDELFIGSNQWHPENQFLLTGLDLDKKAMRCFALKDMTHINLRKVEW